MIYVTANIYGSFDKYKELLKEIDFSKKDMLFVMGNVVDGEDKGIEILFDMMLHDNIYPMLGDHDLVAYKILSGIEKATKKDVAAPLSKELAQQAQEWMESGGEATLTRFSKMMDDDKESILDYFEEFTLYEEIEAGGKEYVLCHNMPLDFSEGDELEDYSAEDMLSGDVDFDRDYFPGKVLITAHKTTDEIAPSAKGRIYKKGSNIGIDCGLFYGGRLAAYCLDDGEEFYV